MDDSLKAVFDACAWSRKYEDRLPEFRDDILYEWGEEEADLARSFFRILPEDTVTVRRSLYLGRDKSGALKLAVVEVEHEDYRGVDPEQFGMVMDPTKFVQYFHKVTGEGAPAAPEPGKDE